jgi:hypothetical protein
MTKALPPWRPNPAVLEKVKHHFLGFLHFEREVYAKRKNLASRLGLSVRTLDRYLHHLAEIGWMETTRRTARTAFRTVLAPASGGSFGGTVGGSFGGSQKKESQERKPPKETLEGKPLKQHHSRDDVKGSLEELEILELAGLRKTAANLRSLRGFVSAGIPIAQIRGGIALGRLRHMSNRAAAPIVSFNFFTNPIAEAGDTYGADQLEHTIQRLNRELARQREGEEVA